MEFEKICQIIAEVLNVDPREVTAETGFDQLGADSLDLYQIQLRIEEEFEIRIENVSPESIRTVGEAFELVKKA